VDLAGDVSGGFGRTRSQVAHLVGDDGEAAARLAATGGFDGGVERQHVGLVSDRGNDVNNRGDLSYRLGQGLDASRSFRGNGDGLSRNIASPGHLTGDLG